MITVISATRRQNSNSLKIANYYLEYLEQQGHEAQLVGLDEVPNDIWQALLTYNFEDPLEFHQFIKDKFFPATKLVFIMPEYHGSYPGILKMVFDACDVEASFCGKKACLVGIASGRAGNMRGMDDLTNILIHMRTAVLPLKLPISQVDSLLDQNGRLKDEETIKLIQHQINELIKF